MKQICSSARFISIITALCLFINPALQCYDQAFLDHVANSNLNTFEVIDKENEKEIKIKSLHEQGFMELMYALITPRKFEYKELNDRDKRETAFKQAPSNPQKSQAVVDPSFINKMELVHGDARPADHLAHRLISHSSFDLIATEFGKKRCMELLAQPVSDAKEIMRRQAIIKELATNDALRTECDTILKHIRAAEDLLFDLYQYDAILESEKILYFSPFFDGMGGNNSKNALEVSTRLQQIWHVVNDAILVGYAWFMPKFFIPAHQETALKRTQLMCGLMMIPAFLIISSVQKQMINMSKNIQQKLIGAATYINGIKRLIKVAGSSKKIIRYMPELKAVANQLNSSKNKSDEFNELCKLLGKSTFKPGSPSFFSSQGNVLMTYKHIVNEKVRREFADALNLLGDLDLYVAIAKKMKIHQKSRVHYSFVQFIESKTPSISATRFWNPFLPIDTVVPNTIEFNTEGMSNMILTGPNTGGKSATLKALMINMLLAQTFGIAAADKLVITPFEKLTCHMNITDDTGGGVSLFKAEVQRAHELMNMVRALPRDKFAFIIIDEIFTGTSPDKAEELSYKFAKQLTEFPHIMFIDATHFKKLTELEVETNGNCKNYHMGVITDENGKVTKYTYTLTEGPSPVNNASQIADEEGIF